jgi:hypothetical protein
MLYSRTGNDNFGKELINTEVKITFLKTTNYEISESDFLYVAGRGRHR